MLGFTLVKFKRTLPEQTWSGFSVYAKQNLFVKHTTNQAFAKLKFVKQVGEGLFGLDGVILNESALKSAYGVADITAIIAKWSLNKLPSTRIKGEFSCFYVNKENTLFVKANPNGTKPWFYSETDQATIVSNSLKEVIAARKQLKAAVTFDEKAGYELLTFGFLLGNKTYAQEIKKLTADNQLVVNDSLSVKQTNELNAITYNSKTLTENTRIVFEQLKENVKDAYAFNKANNYKQVVTLSGGLDARLNAVLGKKLGFKIDQTLAMGQSKHADVTIAEEIAKQISGQHTTVLLDNAAHLKEIDKIIAQNEGLVLYSGSAHLQKLMKPVQEIGLIHSGQMGNVLGGGMLSQPKRTSPNLLHKAYSNKYIHTITWQDEELKNYANEEVAKISERVFNGVNNGSWSTEPFGYYSSPFLQANTIGLLLQIPPEQKFGYRLYFELIERFLPEMQQWKWDRTGMKPSGLWTLEAGKWMNRFKKLWQQKLLHQYQKSSMNPYEFWWREHSWLSELYLSYWEKYKHTLSEKIELYAIASDLMANGTVLEKSQVLTLIGALNFHFYE